MEIDVVKQNCLGRIRYVLTSLIQLSRAKGFLNNGMDGAENGLACYF